MPFLESPEKAFLKLGLAHSVKLVFSYDVWGMKIKTAKFRALRNLYFEDTKRGMSRELRPNSFGTCEKRAPSLEKYRRTFQPRSQYLSVVFENVVKVQNLMVGLGLTFARSDIVLSFLQSRYCKVGILRFLSRGKSEKNPSALNWRSNLPISSK